ncbi:cytochrome P450 302a1, mitochondrial [Fopius arisanus]|uniref:Cytochrome P450 302a1, mitochondrial n=2 Tax=Fopius arisanus TaxID=64838 RepID=A0A9R1TEP7_9HYME|nr:PREDICTED: cytochrome P450 302a1, mitochondrial [Fopius arisanus]
MFLSSRLRVLSAGSKINPRLTTGFASNPRPFEEIPGPKSLPLIGTLHRYLPVVGDYSFKKLHKTGAKKLAEFGPLVREEIVPGVHLVLVFKPEDIAEVFKSEIGKFPERRSHLALMKYRTDRKEIYNSAGLLPTKGEEWWRLRKEFQKDLSKPQSIVNYIGDIDKVMKKFISVCGPGFHRDLLPLLSRLYLELTCLVVFDEPLDVFSEEQMLSNSKSSKLIKAAFDANDLILILDHSRLWRYFETPTFKRFRGNLEIMQEVAIDMVIRKANKMKEKGVSEKPSILENYICNPNIDLKDVVGVACDMLLAGIDTTAYTSSYALYHVSRNNEVQEKLREEVKRLLPEVDSPITSATIRDATYVKAVIKETFRLNPISIGVGRILLSDIVLSGYLVPKGTNVVTQNQVACRLPEYFPDPDSFKPERWLRENPDSKDIHPYLLLPFGHGPRACIARRLAEQNLQLFLLRFFRAYSVEWRGGVIDCLSVPLNTPDGPIALELTDERRK